MKKRILLATVFILSFFLVNVCKVVAEELISSNSEIITKIDEKIPEVLVIENQKSEKQESQDLASINFQIDKIEEVKLATEEQEESDPTEIADPFYHVNYYVFLFNDKLQTGILEPTSTGYKKITPEIARIGISNFFTNLTEPMNIVNNLLQFNIKYFGSGIFRFVINCTVGVGGFYDASSNLFDIPKHEAGLGQTLGYYGIGHGAYFVWPIIGPSSLRETVGFAGDTMLSPLSYIGFYPSGGATTFNKVNDTSFKLGNYDFMVGNGIDPYSALKDAFTQYNLKKVKSVNM